MKKILFHPLLAAAMTAVGMGAETAANPDSEARAFFDAKVQPLLARRCYECHSHEKKIKGGLALDSRSGWQQGGDNGPAIRPGDPDRSLLMKAVHYGDPDFAMPPKGRLPAGEIAILEEWIRSGAHDPRAAGSAATKQGIDLAKGRSFWAFQPIRNPAPPQIRDTAWPRDPLDFFIRAAQETRAIRPVGDASRLGWLRRVSLDLTGLPPTPQEIIDFQNDASADGFSVVVDRLLGSKAYGERWARHWLDLTGYADMMGTSNAVFAEHAWRYRDYLTQAFNSDKPFNAFIREQIAGDLLPADSPQQRAEKIVATGFLMVGDIEIVNPDKAKMETDHIDSQIIKIGQTFLGMTLGCARCHDHKFDPIGLEDYYGIAGALRSSPSSHKMPDMGVWSTLNTSALPETPEQREQRKKQEEEIEGHIARLKEEQKKLTEEKALVTKQLGALEKTGVPPDSTTSTDRPKPDRAATFPVSGPTGRQEENPPPSASPDKDALAKRRDQIEARLKALPGEIQHAEFFKDRTPRAFAMSDGPSPADMPVYIRGNPYAPGPVVPRGALRVASWEPFPRIPPGQSGRLQLADWLADARNPLTARVTVNRIWQKLFGTGIVPSVDYFGARGDAPGNPELLDHLATRFMQGGWSQKRLLRSLVLSRTYGLASASAPDAAKLDPENKLYWRMNRQRLDAEALRDSLLAISGELVRDSGGPALVLENPENCGALSLKGVNPPNYRHAKPRAKQEFERTLYLPVLRNGLTSADRLRAVFDFIDPAAIAGQRNQTVVPTQSLFLLSNELVRKRSQVLADTLLASHPDESSRLEALWIRVFNRPISSEERREAATFLRSQETLAEAAHNLSLHWTELCHSLFASNEFIFRL
jgi:hypothetical protein